MFNLYFTLPPKLYQLLQKIVNGDYGVSGGILKEFYAPHRSSQILELGCGTGVLSKFFSPNDYVGCDWDKGRIEVARMEYPGVDFFVADATQLEPDFIKRFSYIFCHSWIHHIDDECVTRIIQRIVDGQRAAGSPIEVLIMEQILPKNKFANPFGYILCKLDRGRFVRSDQAMRSLFKNHLRDVRFIKGPWYWPVPGAIYHLSIDSLK